MGKIEDAMVEELIEWLEKPQRDEETVREVAEGIVSAIFGYLKRLTKEDPPQIHVGEPFKDSITGKVQTPLWEKDGLWWVVNSDSRYGHLGPILPFQRYAAPTRAAGAKAENKDGWEVGDHAAWMRTRKFFTVLATAEKCVLIEDEDGHVFSEPNDHMEKYYTKLIKRADLF